MTYRPELDKIIHRMGDYMKNCSKKLLAYRIILLFLTFLLVVFIFSNSAQTAQVSSETSGRLVTFLNNICYSLHLNFTFNQDIVRTLAHFAEFGVLGVLSLLTSLSFFGINAKTLIISIVFSLTVALMDEIIQIFSEGRAFQFTDLAVDFAGLLTGAVSVFLFSLLINNHRIKVQRR